MAAGLKRAHHDVDYKQLNSFSSAVLYDSVPKKKKASRLYEVERVITRRRVRYDHEYLIKWRGWSLEFCSWETSTNLTPDLLTNYNKPSISNERLQDACRQFCAGITQTLKSPSTSPIYVKMDLDIWRYVTFGKGVASEHRGHYLFNQNDFDRLKYLPENWWYCTNEEGVGTAVDFPLKTKTVLSWSPLTYMKKNGNLEKAARFPMEKVCVTAIRRACNMDNIL